MVRKLEIFMLLAGFLSVSTMGWAGEISQSKLNDISLGMTPQDIIYILGQPDNIRAEGVNTEGKAVQRMEYSVTRPVKPDPEHDNGDRFVSSVCSLMILDGVLVRIDRQR